MVIFFNFLKNMFIDFVTSQPPAVPEQLVGFYGLPPRGITLETRV